MLASSTHDTKRSEDVRARLSLLSEIPAEWEKAITDWSRLNQPFKSGTCPDTNTEYLIYQTMVGAWPLEKERLLQYLEKATREAKRKTSWLAPNQEFEKATNNFVERIYKNSEFMQSLEGFVGKLITPGRINSLASTLLKLTSPGVPDTYQGTEIWDLSLVDPDNRRPVDYQNRRHLLEQMKTLDAAGIMQHMDDGMPKLWTIYQTLRTRRQHLASFGDQGAYKPMKSEGELAECVLAYGRGDDVVVIVPRLVMKTQKGWGSTAISLPPGEWSNVLGGAKAAGKTSLANLFHQFPVALLVRDQHA
jgi:(1->4)-alpha-D-glucan 1-alpha-D-glucosylmutase